MTEAARKPVGSRVDRDGTANSRRPRPGRGPVQIHLYRRADQYGAGGRGGGEEHAEINSPSRVFRELGSFTGLGFVSGLAGYAERSFAAGADMADSAVDGLSGAIAGLPDLLSGEAEMRPTIRPVAGPV